MSHWQTLWRAPGSRGKLSNNPQIIRIRIIISLIPQPHPHHARDPDVPERRLRGGGRQRRGEAPLPPGAQHQDLLHQAARPLHQPGQAETRDREEREDRAGQRDQQGAQDDGARRAQPVRTQNKVGFAMHFSSEKLLISSPLPLFIEFSPRSIIRCTL